MDPVRKSTENVYRNKYNFSTKKVLLKIIIGLIFKRDGF